VIRAHKLSCWLC